MKTGNPRTAGFLSIVALFAIGFAFFRIFAPPPKHPSSATASQTSSGQGTPNPRGESPYVYGDPFWHPKVASMLATNANIGTSSGGEEEETPSRSPRPPLSLLPGLAPWNLSPPEQTPSPAEPPTPDQQSPKETPKAEFALKAILRVSQPFALISVNGKPTEVYKVGEELAPGVRILSMDDHSIRLQSGKKTVILKVGDKVQL